MSQPGFWDQGDAAQERASELTKLNQALRPYHELSSGLEDAEVMLELEDEDGAGSFGDIEAELQGLARKLDSLEVQALLDGQFDEADVYLSVYAGEGGTDACDWVEILLRLYSRYAEARGWGIELVDSLAGEEAGLRSATIKITGQFAYGNLRGEMGVHRLVRISPFDAAGRRHTAFAAVDVVPVRDDKITVDVRKEDLKVDYYCAGGPGGQHVNRTKSAVRITHLPTGIVAQCQNERSSFRNHDIAMDILVGKLIQQEEIKRDEELAKLYGEKGKIGFGSQIRSYVLHPYTMVNDHRTGVKVSDSQRVLDGGIQEFIDAFLRTRK